MHQNFILLLPKTSRIYEIYFLTLFAKKVPL